MSSAGAPGPRATFPAIRHLVWAKERIDLAPPRFSLASSGLEPAAAAALGFVGGAGAADLPLPIYGQNANGHPRLAGAVAARYGVAKERVLLAGGGTSLANFLVFAALLRPGDEALCERPVYEPLWRALEALGARVSFVERREEDRFALDLDRIAEGLARGARLVVLSDLQNPGGTALPEAAVRELGRLVARHDAFAVVDEVYLDGAFDLDRARRRPPAAAIGERLVSTASLTKVYGLGGLRCGWAIAPPEVVARAYEVNDYLGVESVYIADEASLLAFERLDALAARARARRAETYPLVRSFLAGRRDLSFTEPDGGFIVWAKLPAGVSSDALDRALYERYDAQVTPGSFFGSDDHIRIGYGGPPAAVAEGLRRLGLALDELGATSPAA